MDGRQQQPATAMREVFFKTELCRYFSSARGCDRDGSCPFAHGGSELRDRPDLTKTSLCQMWRKGRCTKGKACQFAHGAKELRAVEDAACPANLVPSCPELSLAHDQLGPRQAPPAKNFSGTTVPKDSPNAEAAGGDAERHGSNGGPPPAATKYCPSCSAPGHTAAARFCAWCGETLIGGGRALVRQPHSDAVDAQVAMPMSRSTKTWTAHLEMSPLPGNTKPAPWPGASCVCMVPVSPQWANTAVGVAAVAIPVPVAYGWQPQQSGPPPQMPGPERSSYAGLCEFMLGEPVCKTD